MVYTLNIRKGIAFLLFPLSCTYSLGIFFRNVLFQSGLMKQKEHKIMTLCVGNLSTGGTGKTPHVEYLIQLLKDTVDLAILSRGYGRKTRGYILADRHSNADTIGDEPCQFHQKFKTIPVAVCEDRNKGVENLSILNNPPQIILLDDAMQHRKIKPTFSILLTDYSQPFFKDCILPFGNLREFKKGYKRADIIIVTKCPPTMNDQEKKTVRKEIKPSNNQKIFFSSIQYANPIPITKFSYTSFDAILVISGIANPKPLHKHIGKNHTLFSHLFPDHHPFSEKDFIQIKTIFDHIPIKSKAIITTEKDAVRMMHCPEMHLLDSIPFFYIPITIQLHDETTSFDDVIREEISTRLM